MALTSPGVEVSVINESFYVPSDAGTTPLFIVASSQDKTNGAGDGTAVGTTTANANTAYLISSQRELTETFGDPKFYTDTAGNSLHGYELNEWGLQAAYSFLGIANRAYVLRANVDTSELIGSATAPTAAPSDGTYWFDLASSIYGIFEWSKTDQVFSTITPTLITSTSDLDGGVSTGAPKTTIGVAGDYAINTTHVTNKIYKKTSSNTWVQVGSSAWHLSIPVVSVASGTTVTSGHTMQINGQTVTTGGTALSDVATAINNANAAGVTASVNSTTGNLEIFHNGLSFGDSTAGNGTIRFEAGASGTLLSDLGITAGIKNAVKFLQEKHTNRPTWKTADEDRPSGSVWFKTTNANAGANLVAKLYSTSNASFSTVASPLYATNHQAIYNLDPAGGGANLSVGNLYAQFNVTEQSSDGQQDITPNVGDFQLFRYEGGSTKVTSRLTSHTFTGSESFTIQESRKNSSSLSTAITITMSGTTSDTFVSDVNGAVNVNASETSTTELKYVKATKLTTGEIVLEHTLGGELRLNNISGDPLGDAGLGTSQAHAYGGYTANSSTLVDNLYLAPLGDSEDSTVGNEVIATNWKRLSYTASTSSPTNEPANGTLWYDTKLEADIMIHNGTTWVGYQNYDSSYADTDPNGPQFSATAPTTQSDATALVDNDLWIDTSDLENFPKLYKYNTAASISSTNTANQVAVTTTGAAWVLVDKADQTTEDGVVFADARWHTTADKAAGTSTAAGTASTIKDLLSDNFLDPDAPDPANYPQGIILWNTRRSGYNVKEYKNSYITTTKYPGSGSVGLGNPRASNESVASYYPDRWVTKSSNNADGSGSFGRKAQRKVIVEQLKSEINTNQAIREDQRGFNVIACPGYPEVIQNMINLNTDRNNTAFVLGDTPLRLEGTSTAIQNWANNTASALDNGEDGLVSSNDYLGVFYPSGLTTDNTGKSIVVPPSHMMLRTLANSDNVSFPWFAPAGTRRGVIDNATSVGYIDATSGEFQTISVTESVRDSMHEVKVNPITFFSGAGIVNFGNLTKTSASSALDRINVSRLAVYLRSQLDAIAKPFIFEPNDELTRNEIKQAIESFLLELVGQRGLYDFLVVCDDTNNTPTRIDRNELYVDIAIEPVKSVEFIYIPLRIKNTGEIANLGN
jgi:phage tail sheath protein FI